MVNFSFCGRAFSVLAAVFLLVPVSCVNEKYEISEERLNLEVTVFNEGVTVPIGSTDEIKLKQALSKLDESVLEYFNSENGLYSISMGDSFDFSEELDALNDIGAIDGVSFSEKLDISLGNVDVSDIKVDAINESFEQSVSELFTMPDMTIPSVTEKISVEAGLGKYVPDASDLELGLGKYDYNPVFMEIPSNISIPGMLVNDTPISLDAISSTLGFNLSCETSFDLTESPVPVDVEIKMPKGIKSVNEIVLNKDSKVKVSMGLKNSIFTAGIITPSIDVDVHELLHLSAEENAKHPLTPDHIVADFELNASNGYSATKEFPISSLAILSSDWKEVDGVTTFSKKINIAPKGELKHSDLATTTRKLSQAQGDVEVFIELEFVNFAIADVNMTIDKVEIAHSAEVDLDIPEIALPKEIGGISNVKFTDKSALNLAVTAENLDGIEGLDLALESLEFVFPKGLKVKGADASGKLVVEGGNISAGLNRTIQVEGIEFPAAVDGKLSFNGNIQVKATAYAEGSISKSELPVDKDVKLNVDVKSALEIADYAIQFNGYEYQIEEINEEFKVEIPESLKDLESIAIYPEGKPVISINITSPSAGFEMVPGPEGLVVNLPEMLYFSQTPAEYSAHTLKYTDKLPETVSLPVEKIVIVPELDPEDGKYYAKGSYGVKGSIAIKAGTYTKADIETLTAPGSKFSYSFKVPELVPSKVNLDKYEMTVNQKVDLDINVNELPKELVAVGVVELNDVYFSLDLDAKQLLEAGDLDLKYDVDIELPSVLVIDDPRMKNGVLSLEGSLDKKTGKFTLDPVKLSGLDLNGVKLSDGLDDEILVNGKIYLEDASVDVDKLFGNEDISLTFNAQIANPETGNLEIAKVTGNVDYQLEPITESIDITDLAKTLNGDNLSATLDLNRFSILFELSTNLGVPVKANIKLEPVYDGAVDEEKAVLLENVTLNHASTAAEQAVTRLCITNRQENCPQGYTFFDGAKLLEVLNNLPDELRFSITAGTDAAAECVFEPGAEYTLTANYAVDIPMEFGEEFELEFRDTIPDLPELVGTILSAGGLGLVGEFTSSLPIELELTANLMDDQFKCIPLSDESGRQVISACGLDGSPVTTELNILFSNESGEKIENASAIELIFKASSNKAPGVPLTEESFVKAALQAIIPNGVTVDLKDFINNEEDNE